MKDYQLFKDYKFNKFAQNNNGDIEIVSSIIIPKGQGIEISPYPLERTKTFTIFFLLNWLKENHNIIYEKNPASNLAFHYRKILKLTKKESFEIINMKVGDNFTIKRKYGDCEVIKIK